MKNRPSLERVKERYKNAKRVKCTITGRLTNNFNSGLIYIEDDTFWYTDKEGDFRIYSFWQPFPEWAEIIEYKDQEPETKGKDPIVNSVIEQFLSRSNEGIEKYGTTLSDNNKDDFLQHLKEELMDAILYIEKVQEQIKEVKKVF